MKPAGPGGLQGTVERLSSRPGCTVLYARAPQLDARRLENVLGQIAGPCSVDWARTAFDGVPFVAGAARFGHHEIAMIAISAPVPDDALKRTAGVSPMPEEIQQALFAHTASIRLIYTGYVAEPVDQLTALYLLAGALVILGGLGVINEKAALAQPAELLYEFLPQLGSEPPPVSLWVGGLQLTMPDGRLLMRTYGLAQFELPDLGLMMHDPAQADAAYHVLVNMGLHMVEGRDGEALKAGDRADFAGRTYLVTKPEGDTVELSGERGFLLLVEI